MKQTMMYSILLCLAGFLLGACTEDYKNVFEVPADDTPLQQTSVYPAADATVLPGTVVVRFDFAQDVWLLDKDKITVNGDTIQAVAAVDNEVRLNVTATEGSDYEVRLAAGAIRSTGGYVSTEDYVARFTCQATVPAGERSPEAERLWQYLEEINGKQILSGTMANVALNNNEAYWVYTKTGRYPAINCIDYIHLYASEPGSWIDYSQTQVMEDWWAQNGIVAAMWHWNMPTNDGTGYTYTPGTEPEQTSFDVRQINDPTSDGYAQMMADIDRVADYLLLLQQKNIPVIWRPLHEAGGRWFWWGQDAEAFKTLWRTMYDRFQQKGLNNLIWVWTEAVAWNEDDETEGPLWYPGDDYVDIVGIDIYEKDAAACVDYYELLKRLWPNKLVTLSECGSVPSIGEQWEAGAQWLWFMTWYDYDRTNDPSSAAFQEDAHTHADAAWWQQTVSDERVITRDEVPSLK